MSPVEITEELLVWINVWSSELHTTSNILKHIKEIPENCISHIFTTGFKTSQAVIAGFLKKYVYMFIYIHRLHTHTLPVCHRFNIQVRLKSFVFSILFLVFLLSLLPLLVRITKSPDNRPLELCTWLRLASFHCRLATTTGSFLEIQVGVNFVRNLVTNGQRYGT